MFMRRQRGARGRPLDRDDEVGCADHCWLAGARQRIGMHFARGPACCGWLPLLAEGAVVGQAGGKRGGRE